MKVFLYGLIIGICKIIPGVSGGVVAVSLGMYDKLIKAICHFFNNKKDNLIFLIEIGLGIVLGIILFSKLILYLIKNYYVLIMIIFVIFIIVSTLKYYFDNNIKIIDLIVSIIVSIIFLIMLKYNGSYDLRGNYVDFIMFYLSGTIETLSSVVPGISGTSVLMMIGMYDKIMLLVSKVGNISYVFNNIFNYLSFNAGIIITFVSSIRLIDYVIDRYKGLSIRIIFYLQVFSILSIIKNILIFFN